MNDRMELVKLTWSKPYFGLTHYGNLGKPWVTVQPTERGALLRRHVPGNFSPNETYHESVEEAKQAGELYIHEMQSHHT